MLSGSAIIKSEALALLLARYDHRLERRHRSGRQHCSDARARPAGTPAPAARRVRMRTNAEQAFQRIDLYLQQIHHLPPDRTALRQTAHTQHTTVMPIALTMALNNPITTAESDCSGWDPSPLSSLREDVLTR